MNESDGNPALGQHTHVAAAVSFDALNLRANEHGLSVRGAFHPEPGEFGSTLPSPTSAGTIVLLGFTGSEQWPLYARSDEASDGLPHPLDRWRLILGPSLTFREHRGRTVAITAVVRAGHAPLEPNSATSRIRRDFIWQRFCARRVYSTACQCDPM